MKNEFDFFAPLDPLLCQAYANSTNADYTEASDVWAIGITTLCYIFNQDFNYFYDWNKKCPRKDMIDAAISRLYDKAYDNILIQVIMSMLSFERNSRISCRMILDKLGAVFMN